MSTNYTPEQRDLLCKIIVPPPHVWTAIHTGQHDDKDNMARALSAIAEFEAASRKELVEALRECAPYVSQAWVQTGDPATAQRHERARALLARIDGEEA